MRDEIGNSRASSRPNHKMRTMPQVAHVVGSTKDETDGQPSTGGFKQPAWRLEPCQARCRPSAQAHRLLPARAEAVFSSTSRGWLLLFPLGGEGAIFSAPNSRAMSKIALVVPRSSSKSNGYCSPVL